MWRVRWVLSARRRGPNRITTHRRRCPEKPATPPSHHLRRPRWPGLGADKSRRRLRQQGYCLTSPAGVSVAGSASLRAACSALSWSTSARSRAISASAADVDEASPLASVWCSCPASLPPVLHFPPDIPRIINTIDSGQAAKKRSGKTAENTPGATRNTAKAVRASPPRTLGFKHFTSVPAFLSHPDSGAQHRRHPSIACSTEPA